MQVCYFKVTSKHCITVVANQVMLCFEKWFVCLQIYADTGLQRGTQAGPSPAESITVVPGAVTQVPSRVHKLQSCIPEEVKARGLTPVEVPHEGMVVKSMTPLQATLY